MTQNDITISLLSAFLFAIHVPVRPVSGSGPTCPGIRSWNISVYNFPPFLEVRPDGNFTGAMYRVMVDMLEACCQWKGSFPATRLLDNARQMTETMDEQVTFAMPVTRNPLMASLYALDPTHTFIPIIDTQGPILLVNSDHLEDAVATSLLASWPLLLVVVGTAGIAAIIIWILDSRRNPTAFPPSFLWGFWEGLWWAFVTMTTVGYGDKTPRSHQGRLFGLIWITLGIVIMSVFTATLAAAFTSATTISTDIRGMQIAVLNGSEEYVVSFSSGAMTQVYPNYEKMVDVAAGGQSLDGMVLDRYFVLYEGSMLTSYKLEIVGVIAAPAVHGISVRNDDEELTKCFANYVMSHKYAIYDNIESLMEVADRKSSADTTSSLLSSENVIIYATLGSWLFLFLVCLAWDTGRRILRKYKSTRVVAMDQNGKTPKHNNDVCVVDVPETDLDNSVQNLSLGDMRESPS